MSTPSLGMRALRASGWLVLIGAAGCSFAARDGNAYRDDTRALLESKNTDIKACYDEALKKDPKLAGNVVLRFKVRASTGKIEKVKVDKAETTAPKSLTRCVEHVVEALSLQPGDQREGDATFRWEFQVPG